MTSSTPEQVAAEVTDFVADRLFSAMDKAGAEWADQLRQSVSKPVGYSGSYVVRSLPGEPPRREHGHYVDSITHQTRREGSLIITEIGSLLPGRGVWLEGGTSRMKPRPNFTPLHDRLESEAADTIKSKL